MYLLFFFFFSSRRRHTRSLRDWSSDVCSSDLGTPLLGGSVFRNQSLASSTLFRRYSNTDPWYLLVPVRVTIETWPPGVRPNSGANVDVWILNSWMASIDARLLKPPVALGCTPDPEAPASTLAPAP